jgi:hypothetical protein
LTWTGALSDRLAGRDVGLDTVRDPLDRHHGWQLLAEDVVRLLDAAYRAPSPAP